MKVIIVGAYQSEIHEYPLYKKFLEKGWEANKLTYYSFNSFQKFLCSLPIFSKYFAKKLISKNENKIYRRILTLEPDIIFFYRANIFSQFYLNKLKNDFPNIKLILYNNDNAFSQMYEKYYWHNYLSNCKFADYILAYRKSDIIEYKKYSQAEIIYFPPFLTDFIRDFPLTKNIKRSGIAFIGHYENDNRLDYLSSLKLEDLPVEVHGPKSGWNIAILKFKKGLKFFPVRGFKYKNYISRISKLLIGICFLSKLNEDNITRRCFELTYLGVCMVSEYNEELANLFKENEEAIYFRNKSEFLEKIKYLYSNPKVAMEIGLAGRKKCLELNVFSNERIELLEKKLKLKV